MNPKLKTNRLKTWGAWRYYSPAYLVGMNGEYIDKEILNQMMNYMSFKSIKELKDTFNSFSRGQIPEEIQKKIKNIFSYDYSENDLGNFLRISEGCVEAINEDIFVENPFTIAQDLIQPEIEIYSFFIEDESSVVIRAEISSDRLFQPKDQKLTALCEILIDPNVPNEKLYRSKLKKYLNDQNIDPNLANDNEFLSEIYQQVIYMADCMSITSKSFTYNDEETYFCLEGEEEFGFK